MKNSNIYAAYRYPAQIIGHSVWFNHRFTLSFHDMKSYFQREELRLAIKQFVRGAKIWRITLFVFEFNRPRSIRQQYRTVTITAKS